MATQSDPTSPAGPGVFTRKATGLVREIGRWDALIMNIIWINLVLGVLLFTLAPAIYPGVNLALGYILTTLVLIIPILVWAWLAAAMPRSGGEYVYISRIIHPAVGFLFNFGTAAVNTLFIAILATFVALTGLSPMFATLGATTDNETLSRWATDVTTDGWVFGIAVLTVLICAVVNWFGLRVVMKVQRVLFGFSILSLGIAAILMALSSRADFKADFNDFGDYDAVVAAAGSGGFDIGATSSLGGLIAFTALGFTVLALSQMPAYTGGELRRPQRTAVFSMIGALLIGGTIFTVLAALAQGTFGLDFLGGMTFLSDEGSDAYPADLPEPFFLLYTGMLTDSTVLIALMTLGVVTALVANIVTIVVTTTRILLAWSVDRIVPDALRKTHPSYHSPVNAVAVVALAAVAILIPLVFGPPDLFNFVFSAATMQAIIFGATAFVGMLFATRLPSMFESSPHNRRVAGIPLMTVLGAIATVIYGYFAVRLITDDRVGANSDSGLIAICIGFGLAIVLYAISWTVNKRRGIDLAAAYKDLPPE